MGGLNITYFNPVVSAETMLSLNAVHFQAATTDCETTLFSASATDSKLVCPDTSLFFAKINYLY